MKQLTIIIFLLFFKIHVFGQEITEINLNYQNYDNLGKEYMNNIKKSNFFEYKLLDKNTNKDSVLSLVVNKYFLGKHKNLNDICDCKKLVVLSLYNLNGDELPDCVFQLKNLKEINLYHFNAEYHEWKELFREMSNLKLLKTFTIYQSPMNYMPETIGLLSSIERIELDNVPLIDFNDEFAKLDNLKYLRVNNTQVYFMPQDYFNDNLIYLDISSNKFNGMPLEINNLPNLEHISFYNNIYYSSDDTILCKNKKLKEIYIGDCGIEKFPIGLNKLENLEQLIVAGNRMLDVPDEIVEFKNLKYLYWGSFVTDKKKLNAIRIKMPNCIISEFYDKPIRPIIDIFE
ncbi:MAG: hypothetical protein PHI14_01595 [Bacteroidales bacterium]|nr:hypothetical protein [Bacteroidales bacterium]